MIKLKTDNGHSAAFWLADLVFIPKLWRSLIEVGKKHECLG